MIHHTLVICIVLFLSSPVWLCHGTHLYFTHCLFFRHFPACRLLWSSRFWSRIWLGLYWAVQFRVSPSLYLLLYTHPHLHLSPPPHSPHASLLLSLHRGPSLVSFCQPSHAFSTSAFHHPLFCRARTFYMLAISLFLFPILRLYHLLQLQLLLSLVLLLSLFSPVNLVLWKGRLISGSAHRCLCSITVAQKHQHYKRKTACLLRPDAMLDLFSFFFFKGNINGSIFMRDMCMCGIVRWPRC